MVIHMCKWCRTSSHLKNSWMLNIESALGQWPFSGTIKTKSTAMKVIFRCLYWQWICFLAMTMTVIHSWKRTRTFYLLLKRTRTFYPLYWVFLPVQIVLKILQQWRPCLGIDTGIHISIRWCPGCPGGISVCDTHLPMTWWHQGHYDVSTACMDTR